MMDITTMQDLATRSGIGDNHGCGIVGDCLQFKVKTVLFLMPPPV